MVNARHKKQTEDYNRNSAIFAANHGDIDINPMERNKRVCAGIEYALKRNPSENVDALIRELR